MATARIREPYEGFAREMAAAGYFPGAILRRLYCDTYGTVYSTPNKKTIINLRLIPAHSLWTCAVGTLEVEGDNEILDEGTDVCDYPDTFYVLSVGFDYFDDVFFVIGHCDVNGERIMAMTYVDVFTDGTIISGWQPA